MKLISCLPVVVIFMSLSNSMAAQDSLRRVHPLLFEMGLALSISLTEETSYYDAVLNLGHQRDIEKDMFFALFASAQYRQGAKGDFAIVPKLRLGKYINHKNNASLDIGYTIYSGKYKALPGINLGINFNKTNKYGFHLRYAEFHNDLRLKERNLNIGLHFIGAKAGKIGMPIVGGVGLIVLLAESIISSSK